MTGGCLLYNVKMVSPLEIVTVECDKLFRKIDCLLLLSKMLTRYGRLQESATDSAFHACTLISMNVTSRFYNQSIVIEMLFLLRRIQAEIVCLFL